MDDYKPTPAYIHRQRGRCCKSLCLHCPYEYTTDNLDFEFQRIDSSNLAHAKKLLDEARPKGVASLMLMQATGDKAVNIDELNMHTFYIFRLKSFECGLFRVEGETANIYLLQDFNDQGIDKFMVKDHFERHLKNGNQV